MNKRTSIVVAVLMAIFTHLQPAKAQSGNTNNQMTAEEVSSLIAFVTKEKIGKKPLSSRSYPSIGDGGNWFEVVVETNGEKITLAYYRPKEDDKAKSIFSIWWRKSGTKGRNSLYTGSIENNGKISAGIAPSKENAMILDATPPLGAEYQEHWQTEATKRYRNALLYFSGK